MTNKELHIAAGYFARITTIKELRGLVIEFPKNIFLNLPALKVVYELDDGQLNVFKDGSKSESIKCPDYAQRHLVATDISVTMTLRSMNTSLSRAFDKDGAQVTSEEDSKGLIDLIIPSKDKQTRHLEYVFQNALNEFMQTESVGHVPEKVAEGFEIVTNRYLKGIQND